MKKNLYLFAVAALFAACKGGPASTDKKDSLTMPYKATYSSSVALSDSTKYVQSVLQSLKDWEDNKLTNAPAYFADTVAMDLWDGFSFNLKRDSLVKVFQKYRDSLSSSKITVLVYNNLRLTDKNEDWVNVWYKQVDTYKTGKIDSSFFQDDNLMVKGKIAYVSDKRRVLKPKK